jgi:hypothetical protein
MAEQYNKATISHIATLQLKHNLKIPKNASGCILYEFYILKNFCCGS